MFDFFHDLSWLAVFQIILIDLLLGGDNAIIIALACRHLNAKQRIQGIIWGSVGAIVLRLILIFFVLSLLAVPFLKIIAAVLLLWIGIKLLLPPKHDPTQIQGGASVMTAIKTILLADLVMSLDNVLAIAGSAQIAPLEDQWKLIVFGLIVSVPIIIWGSTVVLKLLDRYPIAIVLGAALLGWIAGGMILSDKAFTDQFETLSTTATLAAEIFGALIVVTIGKGWSHCHKILLRK